MYEAHYSAAREWMVFYNFTGVAEVVIFQVAKVPKITYDYTLPKSLGYNIKNIERQK